MGASELVSIIISTFASVVVALGGLVVAYLHKKTKRLEKDKKNQDNQIQALNNGFRHEIYSRLGKVEQDCSEVKTDIKLIKEFILKKK